MISLCQRIVHVIGFSVSVCFFFLCVCSSMNDWMISMASMVVFINGCIINGCIYQWLYFVVKKTRGEKIGQLWLLVGR